MKKELVILLLEDNAEDAELIYQMLLSEGLTPVFQHVSSGKQFEDALRSGKPDLIISDYSLPSYNGKAALLAAELLRPGTPFIFFSGTIGEERAIEALKGGATDYVLKEKPKRLVSAIRRALAVAEQQKKQKAADEQIAAQAQLLDLAADAIIVHDLDDRIQFWNQGAERLYGFSRKEIIGKKSTASINPDSQNVFQEAKRATLAHGHWQGEMQHLSKSNQTLIVMSRWTLVRNAAGEPERILAINSDITEKKHLEKQLLRAQRLESVGTLASGIAHDLNNILAPILLACEVLKDTQTNREAKDILAMAHDSAQRGANLVQQLLTFVRGGDGKRSLVQASRLLTEICSLLKKSMPKNITTICEMDPDLFVITADPTQLHQVLMNLCVNARDAMPKGGTLRITAKNATDSFIMIRVEDTGTGIPPEVIDKIFDPFFTTKELGKGTGLGLSTALGIVESHGGTVKVESKEGIGTTFEIMLPAAQLTGKSEIEIR